MRDSFDMQLTELGVTIASWHTRVLGSRDFSMKVAVHSSLNNATI